MLLWEDGKGRGVIMLFTKQDPETPVAVAVEQVSVEGPTSESDVPEYCRDEQGLRRLLQIPLKQKRLVLPVWDAACRRVRERSN